MGYSQRRYFCCCIPTRIAVLVLSALTLAGCVVNGWAIGNTLRSYATTEGQAWYNLDTTAKGILIADAVIVGLLGLSAIAGLIGAIVRNRRLVGLYSFALWVLFVAGLALGSLAIWVAYRNRAAWVQTCIDNSTNSTVDRACDDAYKPALIITIVVFAVIKLIQMYLCVIVARYKHQLDAEHADRTHASYATAPFGVVGNRSAGGPTYVPVQDADLEKNNAYQPQSHQHHHSYSHDQGQAYGTPAYHHNHS